jgi:hypothetical protein
MTTSSTMGNKIATLNTGILNETYNSNVPKNATGEECRLLGYITHEECRLL